MTVSNVWVSRTFSNQAFPEKCQASYVADLPSTRCHLTAIHGVSLLLRCLGVLATLALACH